MVTISFPSTAAFNAAWFTRFSNSAPEKPTVPRAMISGSTAIQIQEHNIKTAKQLIQSLSQRTQISEEKRKQPS